MAIQQCPDGEWRRPRAGTAHALCSGQCPGGISRHAPSGAARFAQSGIVLCLSGQAQRAGAGYLRGDEGEHHDRGEDAPVHDAGVAVTPDLLLGQAQPHGAAEAVRDLLQDARRGPADAPHADVVDEAVDQQADEGGHEDVDGVRLVNVEEDLARGDVVRDGGGGDRGDRKSVV